MDATGERNDEVELSDAALLENIKSVQARCEIPRSEALVRGAGLGKCSLDIEMETGTGKTYVYVKTMFELNKRYDWNKFIVVVPSIAIREGVKKSFSMLEDHFMEAYGKKARYFVYSATHRTKHNCVYALDALDAYRQRLVKKIEVKSVTLKNLLGPMAYIYFDDVLLSKTEPPRARLEIEVRGSGGTRRKTLLFRDGDSLLDASGLNAYDGWKITGMDAERLGDRVHDLINKLTVVANESYGEFVDALQKEAKESLSERPKFANAAYFAGKTIKTGVGDATKTIGETEASMIVAYLFSNGYIDMEGTMQPEYAKAANATPAPSRPASSPRPSRYIWGRG